MVKKNRLEYISTLSGKSHWINEAKKLSLKSINNRPIGCLVVKKGVVLASSTNSHENIECGRVGFPTGEGYDLCTGCQPYNHAEYRSTNGKNLSGATLYMYGHYYICESCKKSIDESGITNIVLEDRSNENI